MKTIRTTASSTATQETPVTVANLISLRRALANVLAEESDFMDAMQIDKVGELQERKLKLANMLERYTRYLTNHPEVIAGITDAEKSELHAVNEYFNKVMRVNYEKLLVARSVNKAIVTCVTGIFAKKGSNEIYNARGAMYNNYRVPISITLNRVI